MTTKRTRNRTHEKGQWKQAWLDAFAETGMVMAACKQIDIGRTTVYEARQADEDFALAWADVEQATTERMEREAYRRAVEGTRKPVYQGGKRVGEMQEYSDTLLIFMLKARKPETYRENVKVEHSGRIAHDLTTMSDRELEAIADGLTHRRTDIAG